MITQGETWALQVLTNSVNAANAEAQRQLAGRQAVIVLLEQKYKAKFDEKTGSFEKENSKNG